MLSKDFKLCGCHIQSVNIRIYIFKFTSRDSICCYFGRHTVQIWQSDVRCGLPCSFITFCRIGFHSIFGFLPVLRTSLFSSCTSRLSNTQKCTIYSSTQVYRYTQPKCIHTSAHNAQTRKNIHKCKHTPMHVLTYEGSTESHEQLFCMRTGNSRRRRVRWQMESAVVLSLSVL